MKASIKNKVQLIGNLGKDPDLHQFENGNIKATATMATHDRYKNKKGESVSNTEWHNLVAYGAAAKLMSEFMKKGTHLGVEGKLCHRQYEDSKGNKRYFTEVQVSEIIFLPSSKPAKA